MEKIVLPGGLRVLMEPMDNLHSATVGIWIEAGSRFEQKNKLGISHFIEHMLFKGTKSKSALDIAVIMDKMGGQINAFTSKEYTCFHAKALSTHINDAFLVLSDMYKNPKLNPDDIDTERGVILEEIGMCEDSPEELVVDLLCEKIWEGSTLEHSILGTKETLENIDDEALWDYMEGNYTQANTVIAIAGNFDSDSFLKLAQREFEGLKRPIPQRRAEVVPYKKTLHLKEKDIEQNHICLGFKGIPVGGEDTYTCAVLSAILGGGMSSRLFQNIRERLGLAYSIGSFTTAHKGAGMLGIYAALSKSSQKEALEVILNEIRGFKRLGVSDDELTCGREQIKANLIMSSEGTSSRMGSLGRGELLRGRVITQKEIIEGLDAVTKEGILTLANRIFNEDELSLSVVGDISEELRTI